MSSRMSDLSSEYLRALYDRSPEMASYLGLHEYDGRVSDPSESARKARVAELRGFLHRLDEIESGSLSQAETLDFELIRAAAHDELYRLEDLRAHEWDPMSYLSSLDVSGYTKRSYAPLEDRVRGMTRHLEAVPEYLSAALGNLRDELPRDPLETAIDAFEGQIAYMRGELRESVNTVRDAEIRRSFDRANEQALEALEGFVRTLRDHLAYANAGFAIGRENYEKMLRYGEMVDLPIERVLEVGEANLTENEELLRETAKRIDPNAPVEDTLRALGRDHPTVERLVPDTADLLESIRAFLIERDVVSVPSEVRCTVRETPPFMRWGFAFMDPPGPFEERATEAYYYITPVEADWSPEQQEEWLSRFNYHTLKDVSVHEAYPGHYLHFLHMNHAPSDVSKVLTSYGFVEGWAHYCEQMMIEAGFGDGDPRLRAAQLSEALLRNCRYVVSIRMHTSDMSVDEATRFLMEHGHMDELPARKEAVRGTFDPGYLNYTLGKLLLLKLRQDYKLEAGSEFSLREFHDRCLSFGAPPVPLLRKMMLRADSGPVL